MYISKELLPILCSIPIVLLFLLLFIFLFMLREKKKLLQEYTMKLESQKKQDHDMYLQQMTDKQITLSALQSQINPHFLYNTLECIRSEALIFKCSSIANIAKSLALFYRYNISNKKNLVTLREELENVNDYFLIQQYRFENKFLLKVLWKTENKDALNFLLPKLTLQPLIENSIFHGLETIEGKGIVTIRIVPSDDLLVLIISDNGMGMEPNTLENLRNTIDIAGIEEDRTIYPEGGIALRNINQRIKLAFGLDYGLHIYSTMNIGTQIEITLPIVTGKGN